MEGAAIPAPRDRPHLFTQRRVQRHDLVVPRLILRVETGCSPAATSPQDPPINALACRLKPSVAHAATPPAPEWIA